MANANPQPAATGKMLRVTLVRSPIGYKEVQRITARAMGLRRLNQTVTLPDTPSNRGMVQSIIHLVQVEEVEG